MGVGFLGLGLRLVLVLTLLLGIVRRELEKSAKIRSWTLWKKTKQKKHIMWWYYSAVTYTRHGLYCDSVLRRISSHKA